MNSRSSIRVVILLCVGALIGPVLHANAESMGGGQAGTIQGPIESLNVAGSRLQVRGQDGKVVTVPIDPATKIRLNGQTSSLSALSVGQRVTIQQSMRDGQPVATMIEVQPGSGASSAGTPGASESQGSAGALQPGIGATEPRSSGTTGTSTRSSTGLPESRSSSPSARPDTSMAPSTSGSRLGGSNPSSGSMSSPGGSSAGSSMSGSSSTSESPAAGTTTR
jgi:hypothetical protein